MRRIQLSVLVICLLILTGCRCERELSPAANLKELILKSQPIDGKSLDLLGTPKFIIVNFWASWCGPCIEETPSLFRLVESHPNELALFSVSEDDSQKELKKFLGLFPIGATSRIFVIHDQRRDLSLALNVKKFPETFIYDSQFKLLRKIDGAIDWNSREILEFFGFATK